MAATLACLLCLTPRIERDAFCIHCGHAHPYSGAELEVRALRPPRVCAACQRPNLPAARFCTTCGSRLPSAQALPTLETEDERRTVTVLHADICGFTRLTEALDPEHTRALVQALFEVLGQEVLARAGTVEAFIGDAILAVFGAPVAHTDDPQRAVETALAIHRALEQFEHPRLQPGTRLRMRVGIETGPVVVGRVGSARRSTITGATLAEAMRLERTARPGLTRVGECTWQQLPPLYEVTRDDQEPGRPTYLVHGRRSEAPSSVLASAGGDGTSSPLLPAASAWSPAQAQTRLDQLAPPEKAVLKLAAIVGRRFSADVLERLGLPEPLPALQSLLEQGLLLPASGVHTGGYSPSAFHPPHGTAGAFGSPPLTTHTFSPTGFKPAAYRPGTFPELMFASEPLWKVAYENNLLRIRRFSHRVVAAWLEEQGLDDDVREAHILHHYQQGDDPVAAARVLLSASQRRTGRHALEAARRLLHEALLLLERRSPLEPEVQALHQRAAELQARLNLAREEAG